MNLHGGQPLTARRSTVELRPGPAAGGLFDWELHSPEMTAAPLPALSPLDEQMVLAVLARQPEQCVRDLAAPVSQIFTHYRRRLP